MAFNSRNPLCRRCLPRGLRLFCRKLARCATPLLLAWVCFFGAFGDAPSLWSAEGPSETATEEGFETELGLIVDPLARPRRTARSDAPLRAQAAIDITRTSETAYSHQCSHVDERAAELASRNGCGAILRC